MYRALFETFARRCAVSIAAGSPLPGSDASAFRAYLDARETAGRPLLGRFAGADAPFDAVSGRCGHRPLFLELDQR